MEIGQSRDGDRNERQNSITKSTTTKRQLEPVLRSFIVSPEISAFLLKRIIFATWSYAAKDEQIEEEERRTVGIGKKQEGGTKGGEEKRRKRREREKEKNEEGQSNTNTIFTRRALIKSERRAKESGKQTKRRRYKDGTTKETQERNSAKRELKNQLGARQTLR